ncbi:MAG: hypothetical protein IH596_03360 [Bacteroidales bacterium]|nr:hypothetical protein [Bacteroidales bacterium]
MKTIKYLTLTLVLFLSGTALFATVDGTTIKETTPVVTLEIHLLIPQVPQLASFEEGEVENMTILLMEAARRFSPVMPLEACFNDILAEDEGLSPVVPLVAPYSETL